MAKKPARKLRSDANGSKPKLTKNHPAAKASPVDVLAEARALYVAKMKATTAVIRADPVSRTAVQHGKDFATAQREAFAQAAPFQRALEKYVKAHPKPFEEDSETARTIDMLRFAVQVKTEEGFAAHGWSGSSPSAGAHGDYDTPMGGLAADSNAVLPAAGYHPRHRAPAEVESGVPTEPPQYVTLDQAAAMVARTKRTLENYKKQLPPPAIQGGGGRANEWDWAVIRPWLVKKFQRQLPERHPTRRRT